MKYRIINKETGKEEPGHGCIVTQDGNVAWWNESQGWELDENQELYDVELLDTNLEKTPAEEKA